MDVEDSLSGEQIVCRRGRESRLAILDSRSKNRRCPMEHERYSKRALPA